jgi:nucleoside-diphosphate-sugar epimerase
VRVLVTGAAGFIGARVVRELLDAGHEVTALLRPGGAAPRLAAVHDQIAVARADLEDRTAVAAALAEARPQGCIHLAWYAEPGLYLQSERNIPALEASLALLAALADAGCASMVAAGTCAEYAPVERALAEDAPTRPDTLYAACKLAFAVVGQQLAAARGVRFAWGRVFHLYGPDEDPRRLVPALMGALMAGREFAASSGDQVRDYLHVDDVARAFVVLLERQAPGVYNIASGERVAIRNLMETIGRIAGRPELIRFGAQARRAAWDPPTIVGDNARLRDLGWSPGIDLVSGLGALFDERRASIGAVPG